MAPARQSSQSSNVSFDKLAEGQTVNGFRTEAILTSPKLRALQTAEIVAAHLGVDVVEDHRLAGALDLDTVAAILKDADDTERPVLVGHDPDFSELVSVLSDAANAPMRKGALARIEIDGPLEPGGGTLRWMIPPDALRQ